jgi:hypothetical protein
MQANVAEAGDKAYKKGKIFECFIQLFYFSYAVDSDALRQRSRLALSGNRTCKNRFCAISPARRVQIKKAVILTTAFY